MIIEFPHGQHFQLAPVREALLGCAKKAKINADYVYMYSAFRFDERLNLETKVRSNIR